MGFVDSSANSLDPWGHHSIGKSFSTVGPCVSETNKQHRTDQTRLATSYLESTSRSLWTE